MRQRSVASDARASRATARGQGAVLLACVSTEGRQRRPRRAAAPARQRLRVVNSGRSHGCAQKLQRLQPCAPLAATSRIRRNRKCARTPPRLDDERCSVRRAPSPHERQHRRGSPQAGPCPPVPASAAPRALQSELASTCGAPRRRRACAAARVHTHIHGARRHLARKNLDSCVFLTWRSPTTTCRLIQYGSARVGARARLGAQGCAVVVVECGHT